MCLLAVNKNQLNKLSLEEVEDNLEIAAEPTEN